MSSSRHDIKCTKPKRNYGRQIFGPQLKGRGLVQLQSRTSHRQSPFQVQKGRTNSASRETTREEERATVISPPSSRIDFLLHPHAPETVAHHVRYAIHGDSN